MSQGGFENNCAVVYGSLPPETKKKQALNFNERKDNVKILLATDAVGIGLNLNINRVIFYSLIRLSNRDTMHHGMIDRFTIR